MEHWHIFTVHTASCGHSVGSGRRDRSGVRVGARGRVRASVKGSLGPEEVPRNLPKKPVEERA